jgi:hypothetical protein
MFSYAAHFTGDDGSLQVVISAKEENEMNVICHIFQIFFPSRRM